MRPLIRAWTYAAGACAFSRGVAFVVRHVELTSGRSRLNATGIHYGGGRGVRSGSKPRAGGSLLPNGRVAGGGGMVSVAHWLQGHCRGCRGLALARGPERLEWDRFQVATGGMCYRGTGWPLLQQFLDGLRQLGDLMGLGLGLLAKNLE